MRWLGLRTGGSTNVLSRQVLLELNTISMPCWPRHHGSDYLLAQDGNFIAGADIHEFPQLLNEQHAFEQVRAGQQVFDRLEALPFTTVAVLNGVTLGGGLELALACDWRISHESVRATIGLPEIQLGVHPGLGGTLRAPRLLGVRSAMRLILAGKPVTPSQALAMGLIDRVCNPDVWRSDAAELAGQPSAGAQCAVSGQTAGFGPVAAAVCANIAPPGSRQSPTRNIIRHRMRSSTCGDAAGARDALEKEARSFARLVFSPTSQNLCGSFSFRTA